MLLRHILECWMWFWCLDFLEVEEVLQMLRKDPQKLYKGWKKHLVGGDLGSTTQQKG